MLFCIDVIHFVMKGDSSVRGCLRKVVESLVDISKKEEEKEEKEEEKESENVNESEEKKEGEGEEEVVEKKKPSALWCAFYTQVLCSVPEKLKEIAGLSILPEPSELIDYKNVLDAAKSEFQRICTNDEEYLPKMPNPEDIIWSTDEKPEEEKKSEDENKPEESNEKSEETNEEKKSEESNEKSEKSEESNEKTN